MNLCKLPKEKVAGWGQRTEPQLGAKVYFANGHWSEQQTGATREGHYLGDDQVAVTTVTDSNELHIDWVGNVPELLATISKAESDGHILPEFAEAIRNRLTDLGDHIFRVTVTGNKLSGKTWVIRVDQEDTPAAG